MAKIVSLDTETTGLVPAYHEVWEVAVVPLDEDREHLHYQFQPMELPKAESSALKVNGFYSRFDWIGDGRLARDMLVEGSVVDEDTKEERPTGQKALTGAAEACWRIAGELSGATILGLNPHFDAAHLECLLQQYGHAATWGHRFLDLGSFAAGAWKSKAPLSGHTVAERMEAHGIVNDDLHNAYSDARWNVDAYQAILRGEVG